MIKRLKDSALSRAIALAVNRKIRLFGRVERLRLNTEEKSIEMELTLKGERETLRATIRNYRIVREEERYFLSAGELATSREWIDIAVREYLGPLRVELPEKYAKMIERIF